MKQQKRTKIARENRLFNAVLLSRKRINRHHEFVSIECSEKHARWLIENLSSFSPRLAYSEGELEVKFDNWEKIEGRVGRWMEHGEILVPEDLTLSSEAAGLWYYHRGSIDSHNRVYFDVHRPSVNAVRLKDILDEKGYGAFVSSSGNADDVAVMSYYSDKFLEWITEPPY